MSCLRRVSGLLLGVALCAGAVDLETLGALAFRYGYPAVAMMRWRDQYLRAGGALNHFAHRRELAGAAAQEAYQNTDTLYSTAWVDLTHGPVTLQVPATGPRYVTLQFIGLWTETFALLTRAELGGRAAQLFLTAPGWNGAVPAGARHLACPSSTIAVFLRLFVVGEGDLAAVHALQDRFVFSPAVPAPVPLPEDYLAALGAVLPSNPPPVPLRAVLARLVDLGLTLERGFDQHALSAADRALVEQAVARSRRALLPPTRQPRRIEGGWAIYDAGPLEPASLEERIFRAQGGPGAFAALPATENVYALGYADSNNVALRNGERYVITLDDASTPPVDGFWSIAVYDAQGHLVPGARHSIHSWTAGLRRSDDGSLRIMLAPRLPLAEQSNWLPAPASGGLRLVLRMYHPRAGILNGLWHPPLIVPADQAQP